MAWTGYRSPASGGALHFDERAQALVGGDGQSFPIVDGIADLTAGQKLDETDQYAREVYDQQAGEHYDNAMDWVWRAFRQDEAAVRSKLADLLDVRPGQQVLEIGCGTGNDSLILARRLQTGRLCLQDISPEMLRLCRERMEAAGEAGPAVEYAVARATPLPFEDGCFDRVFHFGGLNTFSDPKGAIAEMARVTKVGGRVVVGDESLAPWLRETDYGRILLTNNPLMAMPLPLDKLPPGARDASLHFLIGNAYYAVSFEVGDGEPPLDLDLPHMGRRGGTLRTRYYGQMEGVTEEAKRLAGAAALAAGKSMHDWLDEAVRARAAVDLGEGSD
jgi:ubiquinone/menaquinone biosynthesis C-methylase UbiE